MLVAGAEVDLDAAGAQQVLVVEGNARASNLLTSRGVKDDKKQTGGTRRRQAHTQTHTHTQTHSLISHFLFAKHSL